MCAQSFHFLIPLNDRSFSPPGTLQQQQQHGSQHCPSLSPRQQNSYNHKPEEQNPNPHHPCDLESQFHPSDQPSRCPVCQSDMTAKFPSNLIEAPLTAAPGQPLHSQCPECGYRTSTESSSFSSSLSASVLESQTHLLHGVLHANGFGHLLRINGRESGSRFLSGCQLMGLWDGLCSMLNAR